MPPQLRALPRYERDHLTFAQRSQPADLQAARGKLKLGAIEDDKPVKLTHDLPASVHRDFFAYAEILAQETGLLVRDPARLIAPMLARFMATDRSFRKASPRAPCFEAGRWLALREQWCRDDGHFASSSSVQLLQICLSIPRRFPRATNRET